MVVTKKPHQIFIIEHLFYFLVGGIFLFLLMAFSAYFANNLTSLPPEKVGIVTVKALLVLTLLVCHLLMPYSCLRLWVSAGKNSEGNKKVVWRVYAVCLFILLTFFGIKALIISPRIFEAFATVS